MFKKKKVETAPAPELVERWKKIAAGPAASSYADAPRKARAQRSVVFKQATATLSGGEKLPVAIKNLSTTGCRIEFFRKGPLTPTLTIDEHSLALHFEAEVVWQGDGAAGLSFVGAEHAD